MRAAAKGFLMFFVVIGPTHALTTNICIALDAETRVPSFTRSAIPVGVGANVAQCRGIHQWRDAATIGVAH